MKKGPGIPTWLQWAWYLATFIDTKGKQNQKNLLSVQSPAYTVYMYKLNIPGNLKSLW